MLYLENLKLMKEEFLKHKKYSLGINNRYFNIMLNDRSYVAFQRLLEEEIYQVEHLKFKDDTYKIVEFNCDIPSSDNYKKTLIDLYDTFLSLNKVVTNRIINQDLPYDKTFNIKVIINKRLYQLEFSADMTDLFEEFFARISVGYLSDQDIYDIRKKHK